MASAVSETLATLRLLCPEGPIEIRALGSRMHVQRFADHEAAAAWADTEAPGARAMYAVMNAFDPTKIRGAAVDDQAVTGRRWILVDVDPTRPADSNSTREELELAKQTAVAAEGLLSDAGFPAPVRALSGNGAHLLYRVDLPNDPESLALVGGLLKYLSAEYSVAGKVTVDTTVGNAARITKLYSTMTRKGPHSEDRPQRRSRITRIPEHLAPVPLEALRAVAARAPQPAPVARPATEPHPEGEYDLGQVLARVPVTRTFTKEGGTWYVIRCPWAYEHSTTLEDEATVLTVGAGGGLGFRCLHMHCAERRWEAFRDHLGIETKGWQERRLREQERAKAQPATAPAAAPKRFIVADAARRDQVLSRMATYTRSGAMPGSISTGMRRLDAMLLGGFRPGKFYILGGESGRGKSTLLMQWAFYVAKLVRLVGIVTPEMDIESLDERAYSQLTGCSLGEYRRWPEETSARWAAAPAPQNVIASFDPHDIQAFAEEERPSVFIVDYAQQAVDYESERRHTALARLGADCLAIAKQLHIPVILGTQVNVTNDRDFTVRETRILEHQADALIYIDVQYDKQTDSQGYRQLKPGSCLIVDKNRHGASGRIPILWERERFRFTETE